MTIRNILGGFLATAALATMSIVVRADDKTDIQALFNRMAKAVANKSVKGIQACGTKDFTYTQGGQTMTNDQISSGMQMQFNMAVGSPKSKMAIQTCKVTGKTATVTVADYTEMTIKGPDGVTHTVKMNGKSKGTVVKTGKVWLMKNITVVESKTTMDGKLVAVPGGASTGSAGK